MKMHCAFKLKLIILSLLAAGAVPVLAADQYTIDPSHTYPSFEADHMGLSVWRGKFTKTSGQVTLDRAAKTGAIDIKIDAASIDFGQEALNKKMRSDTMFNVEKFPDATYKSTSFKFDGDKPASVEGQLTLHGVTKPVTLTINKFICTIDGMTKRERCGADASASFNRADFGIGYGVPTFSPEVKLAIQVEAIKTN
jgi:polyisoprenoid-binding protein YceI